MSLRISVDVDNQGGEVAVVFDQFAFKGLFEQASCPIVGFVESLGIGAEQLGKGTAGIDVTIGLPVLTS